MTLWLTLGVAAGGALGAAARYISDVLIKAFAPPNLPWSTFTINVVGSFIMGVVAGVVMRGAPEVWIVVIGTGFCGGYTTFSTASLEVVTLLRERHMLRAAIAAIGTIVVTCLAALLGLVVTGAL